MSVKSPKSSIAFSLSILLAYLLNELGLVNSMIDHCYADLGCFPLGPEFYHPKHRPFNARPWPRRLVNTRFELYNRHHPNGFLLTAWDSSNLRASGFNPRWETKILVPGWLDSLKRTAWIRKAKDIFLWNWHPVNIIAVYWRNFTPYTIATANSRLVGAEMANLIKWIEQEFRYDRSYYHLIGHSLGAHISGYCGDRVPGLGRITALDPARPFFQGMPKSVRLDRADANFVDAIHSDFTPENAIFLIMSFGMTTAVGHVDFYPNGPPLLQPGCLRDTLMSVRDGIRRGLELNSLPTAFLEAMRYLTACDHQRSHEWFVESLVNRECIFVGVRCSDYDGLINGRCTCDDSPSACAIMGIHADQMYLNKVHNDLWPLKKQQQQLHKEQQYQQLLIRNQHSTQPVFTDDDPALGHSNKGSYSRQVFVQKASINPFEKSIPSIHHHSRTTTTATDNEQLPVVANFQDPLFVQYLLENLAHQSDDSRLVKRQEETILQARPLTAHDYLMSELSRDLESWYEEDSRWYLKTNRRGLHCVNQYQILVYLGPMSQYDLGQDSIKANLIISIIGTRGQLVNQRFVPRSKRLESYSLQPFFVVLEGTYSLGDIVAVAIAWEPRNHPDPIQATISFKSGPLEQIQKFWPEYQARHPWLPKTMRYDYTRGFINRLMPNTMLNKRRKKRGRVDESRRTKAIENRDIFIDLSNENDEMSITNPLSDPNCLNGPLGEQCQATDDLLAQYSLNQLGPMDPVTNEMLFVNSDAIQHDNLSHQHRLPQQGGQSLHPQPVAVNNQEPLLATIGSEPQLTLKLHNGSPIFNSDHIIMQPETITIRKIVISPIQATYGRGQRKVGRTFCPPRHNFPLNPDQTLKLASALDNICY